MNRPRICANSHQSKHCVAWDFLLDKVIALSSPKWSPLSSYIIPVLYVVFFCLPSFLLILIYVARWQSDSPRLHKSSSYQLHHPSTVSIRFLWSLSNLNRETKWKQLVFFIGLKWDHTRLRLDSLPDVASLATSMYWARRAKSRCRGRIAHLAKRRCGKRRCPLTKFFQSLQLVAHRQQGRRWQKTISVRVLLAF